MYAPLSARWLRQTRCRTFAVTPQEQIVVYVGGNGSGQAGSFNGGGNRGGGGGGGIYKRRRLWFWRWRGRRLVLCQANRAWRAYVEGLAGDETCDRLLVVALSQVVRRYQRDHSDQESCPNSTERAPGV